MFPISKLSIECDSEVAAVVELVLKHPLLTKVVLRSDYEPAIPRLHSSSIPEVVVGRNVIDTSTLIYPFLFLYQLLLTIQYLIK